MPELISMKTMPKEIKIELLRELGCDSDGIFVLEKTGEQHLDRYIKEPHKSRQYGYLSRKYNYFGQ